MPNKDFYIYNQDTVVELTQTRYDHAMNEYSNGDRSLELPSYFYQEMDLISDDLQSRFKWSISSIFGKGLSISSAYILNHVVICLAQIQFGPEVIAAYYLGGAAGSFARAILKTLSDLTFHGPLKNTNVDRSELRSGIINYQRFINNLISSLTAIFPLEALKFRSITPLAKNSLVRITHGYLDYSLTLSEPRIMEAMRGSIMFPANTCFTRNGHENYIGTVLDRRVLSHFRRSLQRFSRIIDEELPSELTSHVSLSWIQKSIHAIRRLVEPLTIPYNIITQRGHYNPYLPVIKSTSVSAHIEMDKIKDDLRSNNYLERSMLLSAKDLFDSFQSGLYHQASRHSFLDQINRQNETISQQEEEIRRLQSQLAHRTPQQLIARTDSNENGIVENTIFAREVSGTPSLAIQSAEVVDLADTLYVRPSCPSLMSRDLSSGSL
tara:strand:+ start:169 stop:1479 length:1311 start_codon:yes stop_codon:yes gene_type:complete